MAVHVFKGIIKERDVRVTEKQEIVTLPLPSSVKCPGMAGHLAG